MSIGPMSGIAGSVAGSPLAQTSGTERERDRQDAAVQQRRVESDEKARAAAGGGETDGEDHETAERDADGRRPWQGPPGKEPAEPAATDGTSKDPTGQTGGQLDLTG